MDHQDLLAIFDKETRIDVEIPGMRKEVLPQLVRFTRPAPGMNMVLYSRLEEDTAGAVIDEQVAYFQPMGQPFEWIFYEHDLPASLPRMLEERGFRADEAEPVMLLDLSDPPPALLAPVTADVRRISDLAGLEDVIRVEEQVWGGSFDWMRGRMGSHLDIPGYLSVYVAYVDGQPAATGWTYFIRNSRFAGLWGGSTLEQWRKRGLYTALLAVRIQEAVRRGYQYMTIDASPMSQPIVQKHGFRLLDTLYSYQWKGG